MKHPDFFFTDYEKGFTFIFSQIREGEWAREKQRDTEREREREREREGVRERESKTHKL